LDEIVFGDGPLKVRPLGEEEGVDSLGEGVDVGRDDDPCRVELYTIMQPSLPPGFFLNQVTKAS
jgi:hypothetical protein